MWLRRRFAADEGGFTMVSVVISMMLLGMFAVGAYAAANGDIGVARQDQDRKRAYEAAQAGVEWYAYQLQRDPTYWEQCASVPAIAGQPAPVTLEGKPHIWRTLTGSQAQYTVEILDKRAVNGARTSCSTGDPSNTALQDGTLRIRATGLANGKRRSIIGTFRRSGFLDYIWYTRRETQDPIISGASNCDNVRSQRGSGCVNIQFANGDAIRGPFHTDDESILTCGVPIFGRPGKSDRFEVAGPAPGYIPVCGAYTPTFNGPKILPANTVTPPPSNAGLAALAGPNWTFVGQTCLVFNANNTVDVYQNQSWATTGRVTCNTLNGGTKLSGRPLTGAGAPPNGVIYVAGNGGSCVYNKSEKYDNSQTCGDVAVSGTYSASLTIGAANDIVVNANLVNGGGGMLGLIASNFVRAYHPVSSCSNVSGFTPVTRIDAAILALQHSFLADNYDCGAPLGTLTINGAIAQYYRGTVGTGNGLNAATGYIKDYNYDDRLKYRSPPNFLDPIETRWEIVRQTEQTPPAP